MLGMLACPGQTEMKTLVDPPYVHTSANHQPRKKHFLCSYLFTNKTQYITVLKSQLFQINFKTSVDFVCMKTFFSQYPLQQNKEKMSRNAIRKVTFFSFLFSILILKKLLTVDRKCKVDHQ